MWDDDEKTLAVTYGAAADTHQARPDRVTAILDADGVLVDYYPVVHVSSHAESVLEDCQALFGH